MAQLPRKRWMVFFTGVGAVLGSVGDQYFKTNFFHDLVQLVIKSIGG